jgi:hypothetical protein
MVIKKINKILLSSMRLFHKLKELFMNLFKTQLQSLISRKTFKIYQNILSILPINRNLILTLLKRDFHKLMLAFV